MSSHERTETHCVGEALDGNGAPAGLCGSKYINSCSLERYHPRNDPLNRPFLIRAPAFFFLSLHSPSPRCQTGSWGPFNRWFVAISFFMCLGRGSLGAPPGRPWAQSAAPGRFTTGNHIQPIPAGELSGRRSGDRATEAPREGRQRGTGVETEWQKKRFRTITT